MRNSLLTMMLPLLLPLTLGACEMKVGGDDDANRTAVSVSSDGNVSITSPGDSQGIAVSVPGFNAKLNIPGLDLGSEHMDIDGVKLYPGTRLQTVNVDGKNEAGGSVDMRFTSEAAPAVLAKYYADSAREHDFTGVSVNDAGGTSTLTANKPDGDRMTITLSPGAKGGTAGRISLVDSK